MRLCLLATVLASTSLLAQLGPSGATASFRGKLPPAPVAALTADQEAPLAAELARLTGAFAAVRTHPRAADVEIFLKAVRYALDLDEWYDKKTTDGIKKATACLKEAESRIASLKEGKTPWLDGTGYKVVGYYSKIDGSAQPYRVEIPADLHPTAGKLVPIWIWLHGRGDTATDLNYVYAGLTAKKPSAFEPPGCIVVHPFGRYCNGWKSAGETDVFECRDDALTRFHGDADRVALAGFSMGGAGAWHIGAHYPSEWAVVHTGAGFADVQRYTKVTADTQPPWYEQKLWGVYDVPVCAQNFRNVPLISYSGENDSHRASADYMTEVFSRYGMTRPHLIGPGMGHKYHPEVKLEVQRLIQEQLLKGRDPAPKKVTIQTRSLAYATAHWLSITGMEQQWKEAFAQAEIQGTTVTVSTKNVSSLTLRLPDDVTKVMLNGSETDGLRLDDIFLWPAKQSHGKRPGLQGPIDDAFRQRFIVILPDQPGSQPLVDEWVKVESAHFIARWRSLMRGDVILRKPAELTEDDTDSASLILWGTPQSNSLLAKLTSTKAMKKVLSWTAETVGLGQQVYGADRHVPVLCLPNPINPKHYIVLNSGLTFREAHDKTNSLQNPKLPDWAILDITSPPSAEAAGRVVAADFFSEQWELLPRAKNPEDREEMTNAE
jgi:hypothetical protein